MTDPIPFQVADQEFVPDAPVSKLSEFPGNPNLGDVEAIAESLDAHGFYGAVLVQKSTGFVIAGNHRFRAALAKGATTIPAFMLDCDPGEARRILAVDNRTTHLATFDEEKLIALLTTAKEEPQGLAGTGYGEGDLAALLRHHASVTANPTNPKDEWEGMPDFDQPGAKPAYSVVVHFPSDEDADTFFALIGKDRPARRFLWWPQHDGHRDDYSSRELEADE